MKADLSGLAEDYGFLLGAYAYGNPSKSTNWLLVRMGAADARRRGAFALWRKGVRDGMRIAREQKGISLTKGNQ